MRLLGSQVSQPQDCLAQPFASPNEINFEDLPVEKYLRLEFIDSLAMTHALREKFAIRLFQAVFDNPNDIVERNCSGDRGKRKLDPGKIAWIRKVVSQKFPPTRNEAEFSNWKKCVKSIDTCKRAFENNLKQGKSLFFDEVTLKMRVKTKKRTLKDASTSNFTPADDLPMDDNEELTSNDDA